MRTFLGLIAAAALTLPAHAGLVGFYQFENSFSDAKIDIIRRDGASAIMADSTATPEPSTLALMGLGLVAAGAMRRAKATR